jgi:hypothetical protein
VVIANTPYNDASTPQTIVLDAGNYILYRIDSYGDGWNGATLEFDGQEYELTGTSNTQKDPGISVNVTIVGDPTEFVNCSANQYGFHPICTDCPTGSTTPSGALFERDCSFCPEGQYYDDGTCTALTTCDTSTQYESAAPTATSDRVCTALTTCDTSTHYESVAPTAFRDRVCTALSTIHPTMDSLTREQHVAYYTNRFGTCDTN